MYANEPHVQHCDSFDLPVSPFDRCRPIRGSFCWLLRSLIWHNSGAHSVKRIRADELEEVVIGHFFKVATSDQYFKEIERKLGAITRLQTNRQKEKPQSLRRELAQVEAEISATFRFQASANSGSEALALISEQLEQLARRKKELTQIISKTDSVTALEKEIPAQVQSLRNLIQEFKRGYAKAPASLKRRLLRKVLKGLVLKAEGLEVSFHVEDQFFRNSNDGSNVIELAPQGRPQTGEDSDLSLLSAKLPIVGNGWGDL